jgi:protein ImuB
LYLYLPDWPIDRLRRAGTTPGQSPNGSPAEAGPFATVIAAGGRRLLAAVNPQAAAAGLAPGMPLADALSFLPGLATAAADPAADATALTRLAEWCGRYSPWTAPDGSDGIKIEITGCAHLWGGEAALAADLARRLDRQSITHRIAIAGSLGAASALVRFAASQEKPALPPTGGERDALAPLPIAALRLDPVTVQGLRRVGLKRIGELYPMPRDALARRFGETVAQRLDQALDLLPEPLSPLGETPTRRVRLSFAEPIADPADLARAAERLAADLGARLAREGVGARRFDLGFHRIDGRVERIRLGTARPNRDPRHLARLFAAKLDTIDPGLGIEDMILAVYAIEPLSAEQIAIAGAAGAEADGIAPLIDRLGARFGLDAVGRLEARESHIPERTSVTVPVGQKEVTPGRGRRSANPEPENSSKPPRPVRLFEPPEPVEAWWVVPDDPPFRFLWRRRDHLVARADGAERIAEEWWVEGGPARIGTADAIRDYYRVEDSAGRRFWLFRAGLADGENPPRWFLHGVFA